MEAITHPFTSGRDSEFLIYPLGDIHAGSIDCDEEEIKAKVKEIASTRNAYWIGMGDYADCILKEDDRFDIGGLASWVKKDNIIETQRNWIVDLFEPIRGKCLGLLTGNHEEKIHRRYQDDITRNICKDLDVKYLGYSCFVRLNFTRNQSNAKGAIHDVVIHAWHGAGSAQTEGARLMRLMRLVNEMDANIYLMGHLHALTQHIPNRLYCNWRTGRVRFTKLIATITGAWLKTYRQQGKQVDRNPSYAEMAGYKPCSIGCPIIRIKPFKGDYRIES